MAAYRTMLCTEFVQVQEMGLKDLDGSAWFESGERKDEEKINSKLTFSLKNLKELGVLNAEAQANMKSIFKSRRRALVKQRKAEMKEIVQTMELGS